MAMELRSKAIIDKIEESRLGFLAFLLLLGSVILVRIFLEDKVTLPFQHRFFAPVFLHHSATFFLSAFLSSTLLVCILSKEKVDKVSKTVLLGFGLIVIPPIIDYFTSKTVFYDYIYDPSLPPSTPNWTYLIRAYLTFSTGMKGVTLGQQIEMILLLVFSTVYVYTKTRSAARTILTPISVYTLTFFYGTFINYFSFGSLYETFNSVHNLLYYSSLFAVLIFIQGILWLRFYDHSKLQAIIRKLDVGRTFHYLAMGIAGAWIAGIGYYTALLVLLCTFSGWLMSLAVNDIYDRNSAQVLKAPNQNATGNLTSSEMKAVALFCGLLSLLVATVLSYGAIVIVVLCIAVSILYSLPPLRLKKYPIISTFLLSSAAVLVFALGFYAEPPQRDFPTSLLYAMLICFTLSFNTKDLKDYDKDRANKVWTIPVLFGPKKGRILIAALDLLAYLLVPVILQMYTLLLPAVVFGVLTFFVVLRKESKEWQIFLLYFLFLASVFILS
jgi:4-hydroxybenzoate polyprenyltransferase